jgi:LEA14-like dessication related protein
MKYAIIFSILIVILGIIYWYYYNIENNIEYSFEITGVNGNVEEILSFIGSNKSQLKINYDLTLKNNSDTDITFKDVLLELYYNGILIGFTPANQENLKTTVLKASGSKDKMDKLTYKGSLLLLLNKQTVNVATKYFSGVEVNIDYKIKLKVTPLGIPVSYKDKFSFKK